MTATFFRLKSGSSFGQYEGWTKVPRNFSMPGQLGICLFAENPVLRSKYFAMNCSPESVVTSPLSLFSSHVAEVTVVLKIASLSRSHFCATNWKYCLSFAQGAVASNATLSRFWSLKTRNEEWYCQHEHPDTGSNSRHQVVALSMTLALNLLRGAVSVGRRRQIRHRR